jgi:hypothetical protein
VCGRRDILKRFFLLNDRDIKAGAFRYVTFSTIHQSVASL